MYISLIIGTIALLVGSELLIHGSKLLAYKLRVSELFVSMTIIALGTSLPELTISVLSVARNDTGLATGNIVGSTIINATLVLGLATLIRPLSIGTSKTQKNATILLYITILFIILYLSSFSHITIAGILLGMAIVAFLFEYVSAVYGRAHEDRDRIVHYPKNLPALPSIIVRVSIGLAGLVGGGILLVNSITTLAETYNLSTTFLGLTLTSMLTTLPELITSVLAQFGRNSKMALGNVFGSNIFNLALIGGIISIRPTHGRVHPLEFLFLFASSAFIWFISRRFKGATMPRYYGVIMILMYITYLYATSFDYLFSSVSIPFPPAL